MIKSLELNKAKPIRKGDCIGIVAPSSGAIKIDSLDKEIRFLQGLDFNICVPKDILNKRLYTKKEDKRRADDINEMFANKKIKAILCAKGGSGSERLIPFLNTEIIKKNPKIFIAYSDITSILLYLLYECSLLVFHGPLVCNELVGEMCPVKKKLFFDLIVGKKYPNIKYEYTRVIKGGVAQGRLVGGCLTLVEKSLGKSYEIDTKNKILFLEDLSEPFTVVRRMLNKMKKAGKFDRVKGIVFGEMINCGSKSRRNNAKYFDRMISRFFEEYTFPIITGFPSGHGYGKYTLPLGVKIRLNSKTNLIKLLEDPLI